MAEIVVLLVIAVGIYKRGGKRFEWSRRSLGEAARDARQDGERLVESTMRRGRRTLPQLIGQCVEDMGSLIEDILSVVNPRARKQIRERARQMLEAADRNVLRGSQQLATAGAPAPKAYESLQKRYLEGSISLDRYVEEAERLTEPS